MGAGTDIQWTWSFNSDGTVTKGRTWNITAGCDHVSSECKNCYADSLHTMRHKAYLEGKALPEQYAKPFNEFQLFHDRLDQPLHWRTPCRVFVDSMSDLMHKDCPTEFIAEAFAVMALANNFTFLVLTKRIERFEVLSNSEEFRFMVADAMRRRGGGRSEAIEIRANKVQDGNAWPLRNVWIGTSAGTQASADKWIPSLLRCRAAIRFVSGEPLLERVDYSRWMRGDAGTECDGLPCADCGSEEECGCEAGPALIDWVIGGFESGPRGKARPGNPDAARALRDDCDAAGVPFFWKQNGEYRGAEFADEWMLEFDPEDVHHYAKDKPPMLRVGKKNAGRLLDGREHNAYPKP